MAASRVTLSDVAARAGVSRTTASYVTTGRDEMRISSAAADRVREAARELGYRPSLIARGLRTQLTQTIGLISDVIATEPYAGELIRGATAAGLRHQQLIFVAESGGDPAVESQLIQSMLDRGVDGFLYAAMHTKRVRLPQVLRRQRVVLLNCVSGQRGVPAVVPDERAGGRSAARVLLEAGHRDRIVLVGETPEGVIAGHERLEGITAELAAFDVTLAGHLQARWWPDSGHAAVRAMLRGRRRPTALICLNDRIAFGAYQALAEAGLSIPDDVSVVSFDDSDLASWLRPHLTSVGIPHLQIGARAAARLLDADPSSSALERVPMPVRLRDSVAPV
jgi:LacI family transcriptional regulator